jgi:hypothetical protein
LNHKLRPPKPSNSKVVHGKSQDTRDNSQNEAVEELGEDSNDKALDKINIDQELLKLKEMLLVLTREDFITIYKLEGDGTNPHKIKKDEMKEDLVSALFGRRYGKQGRASYRWADCKNPLVLGRVKHLHPILYQHSEDSMLPFLKIKFGQGIAMEENGRKVDWAGFGQETNQTQHSRIEGLWKKPLHCRNVGLEVSKDSWKKVKVEKGKASDSRQGCLIGRVRGQRRR